MQGQAPGIPLSYSSSSGNQPASHFGKSIAWRMVILAVPVRRRVSFLAGGEQRGCRSAFLCVVHLWRLEKGNLENLLYPLRIIVIPLPFAHCNAASLHRVEKGNLENCPLVHRSIGIPLSFTQQKTFFRYVETGNFFFHLPCQTPGASALSYSHLCSALSRRRLENRFLQAKGMDLENGFLREASRGTRFSTPCKFQGASYWSEKRRNVSPLAGEMEKLLLFLKAPYPSWRRFPIEEGEESAV